MMTLTQIYIGEDRQRKDLERLWKCRRRAQADKTICPAHSSAVRACIAHIRRYQAMGRNRGG